MTPAWRSWLPDNASAPRAATGAVADMVDGWSREWFARDAMRTAGAFVRVTEARSELGKSHWQVSDAGVAIGLSASGVEALGARVLGLSGDPRTPADVSLIERVGAECLDDLKRRATVLLNLPKATAWHRNEAGGQGAGPVHRVEITDTTRSLVLTLQLDADRFTRFIRARLPAPPPPKLGSPEASLAPLPVRLSALLGPCRITVSELGGLTSGDVLVLERRLDDRLPLAIEGKPAARGTCSIAEAEGALALKITQSPVG